MIIRRRRPWMRGSIPGSSPGTCATKTESVALISGRCVSAHDGGGCGERSYICVDNRKADQTFEWDILFKQASDAIDLITENPNILRAFVDLFKKGSYLTRGPWRASARRATRSSRFQSPLFG